MRMCVGCRVSDDKTSLLRVVGRESTVVPDPQAILPGRGAYLHRQDSCVQRALRRRAFGRALRLSGPVDVTLVREYLESHNVHPTPLEGAQDEHPMSVQ